MVIPAKVCGRVCRCHHFRFCARSFGCKKRSSGFLPESLLLDHWPTPVRNTVGGLGMALSLTLIVPLRTPFAVGLNDTWSVQLYPIARLGPQLFCKR
jgi:hypothetical protein